MEEYDYETGIEVQESGDDDDLYGDLENDIFGPSSAKRLKQEEVIANDRYNDLVKENQELRLVVEKLKRENLNYSNNISSLLLTAKNEVEKKNFIIKNLSDKLKSLTKSKSALSNKEAEEILKNCQEALHESQHVITLEEIRKCLKTVATEETGFNKKSRKRKHIKFGNMSLYFFSEQAPIQREEEVIFPNLGNKAEPKKVNQEVPNVDDNDKVKSTNSTDDAPLKNPKSTCDKERRNSSSSNNLHNGHQDVTPTSNPSVHERKPRSRSKSPSGRRRSYDRDKDREGDYRDRTRRNRSRSNERQYKRKRRDSSGSPGGRRENRRDDSNSKRRKSLSKERDRDLVESKEKRNRKARDQHDIDEDSSKSRSSRRISSRNTVHDSRINNSNKRSTRSNK